MSSTSSRFVSFADVVDGRVTEWIYQVSVKFDEIQAGKDESQRAADRERDWQAAQDAVPWL